MYATNLKHVCLVEHTSQAIIYTWLCGCGCGFIKIINTVCVSWQQGDNNKFRDFISCFSLIVAEHMVVLLTSSIMSISI